MKPKGSLPCSQEHATGPILSHIISVHILRLDFFPINFNITSHQVPSSRGVSRPNICTF